MVYTVRYMLVVMCAVLALGLAGPATATVAKVNVNGAGVAIEGYDPVAYFELSKPVEGKAKFQASFDGATYQFSSQRHLELFKKNPEKYLPEYGGYCAFGMRYGQTSRVDPHTWNIVDGRLYLSLNHGTQAVWQKKPRENITIADQLWKKLIGTN